MLDDPFSWCVGLILLISALGVLFFHKPVHASLSFLVSLFMLAILYLRLSAEFIAVLQVLVYAGAILVIFMFVIVLFQDAHDQLENFAAKSKVLLIGAAAAFIFGAFVYFVLRLTDFEGFRPAALPEDYGYVEPLGKLLYVDYFLPFEASILLFVIALVGALFLAKKEI